MEKSLDKKIRNCKIKRNIYGAVAGLSLIFAGYNLVSLSNLDTPKNYEKLQNLKQQTRNLNEIKERINSLNTYTSSIQEIKKIYKNSTPIYNKAIQETKEKISELENPKIIQYENKMQKKRNLALGSILSAFLFGMGTTYNNNKKKDLKIIKEIQKINNLTK